MTRRSKSGNVTLTVGKTISTDKSLMIGFGRHQKMLKYDESKWYFYTGANLIVWNIYIEVYSRLVTWMSMRRYYRLCERIEKDDA